MTDIDIERLRTWANDHDDTNYIEDCELCLILELIDRLEKAEAHEREN